jgi:DNA polymerase-3 subunit epsilon
MNISRYVREIVLDTETTGLSFENGDRIVDVAAVELLNHVQTGRVFQAYVNPERKMSAEASAVSGITDEFLADKPLFRDIADEFLAFTGNAGLVIHNAKFDLEFLNGELALIGKSLPEENEIVDTLEIAREKFPGMPANLQALCKRFGIDTSGRVRHGALIDCKLLAEVYINLLGGRQSGLSFDTETPDSVKTLKNKRPFREARHFPPSEDEISAHEKFLQTLNSALWSRQ